MKRIVFITDAPHDPRMAKRQATYLKCGYEVDIYAFVRPNAYHPTDTYRPVVIGDLSGLRYVQRLKIIFQGVKRVVDMYKGKDVVYHIFNLQIGMFFNLVSNAPYIYEEADLVHTYIRSKAVQRLFECADKRVIGKSRLSLFTSEGFVRYHYGERMPYDYCLVPNSLSPSILSVPDVAKKHKFDASGISLAFVGGVRFESTMHFMEHVVKHHPNHVFHFFGVFSPQYASRLEALARYPNFVNHGPFKNPQDMPSIYAQIDMVLSTYDVAIDNVKYAEPNKLYEAIYFRTPIIVTKGTFLASRVKSLGIGYELDPLDDKAIDAFLGALTDSGYNALVAHIATIDRKMAVDNDEALCGCLQKAIESL